MDRQIVEKMMRSAIWTAITMILTLIVLALLAAG